MANAKTHRRRGLVAEDREPSRSSRAPEIRCGSRCKSRTGRRTTVVERGTPRGETAVAPVAAPFVPRLARSGVSKRWGGNDSTAARHEANVTERGAALPSSRGSSGARSASGVEADASALAQSRSSAGPVRHDCFGSRARPMATSALRRRSDRHGPSARVPREAPALERPTNSCMGSSAILHVGTQPCSRRPTGPALRLPRPLPRSDSRVPTPPSHRPCCRANEGSERGGGK
jgi:hypothetical protein